MANEQRLDLIERKAVMATLEKYVNPMPSEYGDGFLSGLATAMDVIEAAQRVDAVPVVHGRWEKAHISGYLKCNRCKDAFIYADWLESGKWNFCPNCGAKMDGGKNDG